jgi:hypothetical protein
MADPKHNSKESYKDSQSSNIQAVASIREVPKGDTEKREEPSSTLFEKPFGRKVFFF